jgi:hypothetical protein
MNEYNYRRILTYFERIQFGLKKRWRGIHGIINRMVFALVKGRVLRGLTTIQSARYDQEFVTDFRVRERFKEFYRSTLFELENLRQEHDMKIPLPTRMIFGHTHDPVSWGAPDAPTIALPELPEDKPFTIYNSGGWLPKVERNGKHVFYGAEVFFYDSHDGFSSIRIGDEHSRID